MKTYKVVDLVLENSISFTGTFEECQEWKFEQGYGYAVLPLTLEELKIYNHDK